MEDVIYVWGHALGPEVEEGGQRGQQLGEDPGCCG